MAVHETCICGRSHHKEQGALYYVAVRDADKTELLYGPFNSHADALANVNIVCNQAVKLNEYAWFYSFGTVAMKKGYREPGILNKYLPPIEEKV